MGLATKVAGDSLRTAVAGRFLSKEDSEAGRRAHFHRAGTAMAQTLGELKGAAMKVGQMASVISEVLPSELTDALASLRAEAPAMPYDVIAAQIEREFSQLPEQLFSAFDPEPFASASIGQVHRATLDDGRDVVVKVQYPGVDTAVDADLRSVRFALRASGLLSWPKETMHALFEELRARLHEELDYCNEADNVRRFRRFHANRPWVVLPDVVGERSSQRVLTLTYEGGASLEEAATFPQDVRDELGQRLFTLFTDELFVHHAIHADPNPGNFAFRRDGTVVMYDFGCVKDVPRLVVDAYAQTVRASLEADWEAVEAGLLQLGARNPGGPRPADADYARWRKIVLAPFLTATYDYGVAELHRQALAETPKFLGMYRNSFLPPKELIFVDRTAMGHYHNLKRLGVQGPFQALLRSALDAHASQKDESHHNEDGKQDGE